MLRKSLQTIVFPLLIVVLCLSSQANIISAKAETTPPLNGLAYWYICGGDEKYFYEVYREYFGEISNGYDPVTNEAFDFRGVTCGEAFSSWLDNYVSDSSYLDPLAELVRICYDSDYEFDDYSYTSLTQSELYGWGRNENGIAVCDEYYLLRVNFSDGGYWEDICVRLSRLEDGMMFFDGFVYGNAPRDTILDEEEDDYYEHEFDQTILGDHLGDMYVVNCNEWVSLRNHANESSARLIKVPLGSKVSNVYNTNSGFYYCEYNGYIGFIKKQYLSSTPPQPAYNSNNPYDLNNYDYKPVITLGRGPLVFQKAPRGSFLSDFKFYDGDWIYVNTKWRKDGYTIAYQDGVYGYVDTSYISW